MQVIHLLPAVRIAVDDQAVAVIGDAELSGQIPRHQEQSADQRSVAIRNVVGGGMGLLGMMRMCTGARGWMSRKAVISASL